MINKIKFFIAFLISVLVVGPAFSEEKTATENWVKTWVPAWADARGGNYFIPASKESDFYPKTSGDTLFSNTATMMRDLLYEWKNPKGYNPNYAGVKNPLRTTSQNAFGGINELLTKVDGNDGTSGSAVELETNAKNAFGAINELKQDVDTVYDNGTQKRVNVTIVNDFTSNDFNAIKAAAENND